MIARNDATRIARCLKSVQNVVDEIIVVDTGSTDGTQKIARELGATVVEREWPEDFSEALNGAFDLVTHEWTLRLDSDEWLLPGSAQALKAATAQSDVFACTVVFENYQADGRFSEQLGLRLWRTAPEMRLTGVIHEQFTQETLDRAAKGRKLTASKIRIGHDGYLTEAMPEKHRRNLALIEKELRARPGNKYYEAERVRTLFQLADPTAEAENERFIDDLLTRTNEDIPPSVMVAGPLILTLDRLPDDQLQTRRTSDILTLARGWFPREPAVTYAAAKTYIRRNDLRSALDALLDLEDMATTSDYDRTGFTHPAMLQEALWQNLALVAHQLGKKEVAARNYARLLDKDPNHPIAKQNMPLLLRS